MGLGLSRLPGVNYVGGRAYLIVAVQPPERRKCSGRKRGGQQGHPGCGPELLLIERVDEVVEHHPDACHRCGQVLNGVDPDPLHQRLTVHRLHRLVCPYCSTSTCATLPADVEASHYGPRLSALVGLLGSAFPLSFSKTQALLQQLAGVKMSRGAIARVSQCLSEALEQPMQEALAVARQHQVTYVVDEVLRAAVETGAPTSNADGNNPTGKWGWQWVMVTPLVTVFLQSKAILRQRRLSYSAVPLAGLW
jgi:transposase